MLNGSTENSPMVLGIGAMVGVGFDGAKVVGTSVGVEEGRWDQVKKFEVLRLGAILADFGTDQRVRLYSTSTQIEAPKHLHSLTHPVTLTY